MEQAVRTDPTIEDSIAKSDLLRHISRAELQSTLPSESDSIRTLYSEMEKKERQLNAMQNLLARKVDSNIKLGDCVRMLAGDVKQLKVEKKTL